MARYLLNEKAYIDNCLRAPGETVVVPDDFVPGPHMVPALDEKGREDKAARAAKDKAAERSQQMPAPGDPRYIGNLIAHTIGDGRTEGRVESDSAHPQAPVVDENGVVRGVKAVEPPPDQSS